LELEPDVLDCEAAALLDVLEDDFEPPPPQPATASATTAIAAAA
jgi:hypothetical protein